MNKRAWILGGTTLFALAALAVAHVNGQGNEALAACDAALANNDFPSAIGFAEDAARNRVPFTSSADEGFARLDTIADTAVAHHDAAMMARSYAAMREAADSTGQETWKLHANEGLLQAAALEASAWRGTGSDTCGHSPHCMDAMRSSLSTARHPSLFAHGILAGVAIAIAAILLRLTRKAPEKRLEQL